VSGVIGVVVTLRVMATVPGSASLGGSSVDALEPGSSLAAWNTIANVLSWVGMLWALVLLISTATNPMRRGVHDRLGGSLVVGRAPAGWAGYAYPAQAYPPQAYPPQGGYPYPPQGGYPQGGAGYPGPGGVPPAAPPATPPAASPDQPKSQKPGG
jgi:hypothetical protein